MERFIVGSGRCGSTLLNNMLAKRPDVAMMSEFFGAVDRVSWQGNDLLSGRQFYGDTYQVLTWDNCQVHLNNAMAKIGADGMFYFAISHQDPGIANWLDVDGHEQGIVMARTRTRGPTDISMPVMEQVPMADVVAHLPKDIALVTASERTANLAIRRRHYQIRENC